MHPTLALHLHPGCTEVIEALERCHAEHTTTRYLGACNAAKQAVNECFKKVREEARSTALLMLLVHTCAKSACTAIVMPVAASRWALCECLASRISYLVSLSLSLSVSLSVSLSLMLIDSSSWAFLATCSGEARTPDTGPG